MSYECQALDYPVQPTLAVRTSTPVQDLPQALGQAYMAVTQYLNQLGEPPIGPPFVVYYNMNMENLDIEAGYPVAKKLPGQNQIQSSEIPAGKVATCVFTGPYSELGGAYEALTTWINNNGYQATGVVYEFYLNNPQETPPEGLQTQIVFPLKD